MAEKDLKKRPMINSPNFLKNLLNPLQNIHFVEGYQRRKF